MKRKPPSDNTLLVVMSHSNKMNVWINQHNPCMETLHRMYHLELKRDNPRKRVLEKIEAKYKKAAIKALVTIMRVQIP